jgi:ABC-type multidrug transport system ATPase subunit
MCMRSATGSGAVIGHVSQDDLLIEELTVFQNLFFNAKLCFGDQTNRRWRSVCCACCRRWACTRPRT